MGRAAAGRQDAPILQLSAKCSISPVSCEAGDCWLLQGSGPHFVAGHRMNRGTIRASRKMPVGGQGRGGKEEDEQPFSPPG